MPVNSEDDALAALFEVYDKNPSNISKELVKAVYDIEKRHQYERDRSVALNELHRIITIAVEKEFEGSPTEAEK